MKETRAITLSLRVIPKKRSYRFSREQTDALRYLTDNQKAVLASKLELKMAEEEGRDSHFIYGAGQLLCPGVKIKGRTRSKQIMSKDQKGMFNLYLQ